MLSPDFRFPLRAVSGLVLGLWASHAAQAQTTEQPPLLLRPSPAMEENIGRDTRKQLPSFLQTDQLNEQAGFQTALDGQVIFRRGDLLLKADHIDYDANTDLAKAKGHVYVNFRGTVYSGPELEMRLDAFEGFFSEPNFQIVKNKAYGNAALAEFVDSGNTIMHKANFTTCQRKPGPDWMPDWLFKGDEVHMDTDRNIGYAKGAHLEFKGVPILPLPSVDFPLGDERKSGLLPPSIGADNIGGLEYTQPYYWNLAPNRDMTFYPTYWSKRGINVGTELRYLESVAPNPPFQGLMRADYMEKDLLRDGERRWSMQYSHAGVMRPYVAGGAVGLNLNVNRVSDDNYWKDFSLINGGQRLLSNDMALNWTNGVYTTGLKVQKWQTLQDLADVNNRITPPFDRLPQLTARMQKLNLSGFDFTVDGDFSRFSSTREIDCTNATTSGTYNNCAPNANRYMSQVQLSRPFVTPYSYITPKIQVNSRSYQFDGGLYSNNFYSTFDGNHVGQTSASVTVPTLSLDAGLAFERPSNLFSRNWTQTLEPRLFYVFTPYRDQNYLPNYDSGSNAFNFASIYTENAFGGYDRISDSKTITMGVTSRLVDVETGAEGARFGVAQRLRMQDQRVTIPEYDATAKSGMSDLLAGAAINLSRSWAMESTLDYNPNTNNYLRRMVGGRYSPGSYRMVTAAYRADNDEAHNATSRQVDLGWQWPLHDLWGGQDLANAPGQGLGEGRWYSVARMNYSPLDKKVVESIVGFEYDAGCWISRTVVERMQVADGVARQRILFQLEFVGFSRLGTNALGSLRNNIQRYQPLRQPTMAPSRFGNYD